MARTYYFLDVENLSIPADSRRLITSQQGTFRGFRVDAPPVTSLEFVSADYYRGLSLLRCRHEVIDRRPRRLFGEPAYVPESIAGGNTLLDVYYSPEENFAVFCGGKRVAHGAFRALSKEFPDRINVRWREVNLQELIGNTTSTVIGAWFSKVPGNVEVVGLFGDRVNLSEDYTRFQAAGSMTTLYVSLSFSNSPDVTHIAITKERGVIVYEKREIQQDLDLLLNLWPLLKDSTNEL